MAAPRGVVRGNIKGHIDEHIAALVFFAVRHCHLERFFIEVHGCLINGVEAFLAALIPVVAWDPI